MHRVINQPCRTYMNIYQINLHNIFLMIKIILMEHLKTITLGIRSSTFYSTTLKEETGTYLRFPVYFFRYFYASFIRCSSVSKCGCSTDAWLWKKKTSLKSKSCFQYMINICILMCKCQKRKMVHLSGELKLLFVPTN